MDTELVDAWWDKITAETKKDVELAKEIDDIYANKFSRDWWDFLTNYVDVVESGDLPFFDKHFKSFGVKIRSIIKEFFTQKCLENGIKIKNEKPVVIIAALFSEIR